MLVVVVVRGDLRERERERQTKRENTLSSSFFLLFCSFLLFLTTEKRHSKKRERDKILGEKEGVGDVELSSTSPIIVSFTLTHINTHTHTHTHNVRFTIPNRRRQGRLQSCRQQATTIHRRLGEDCPRQRYALEERTIFQGRRTNPQILSLEG